MSINSVSFYQQDQNYWQKAQAESQAQSANASLIDVMGQAEVNQAKGLASIANGTALNRVNSELTAAVQAALGQSSSSSSSTNGTGSSSSTSSASGSSNSSPTPATAVGTVPMTTSTPLSTLGILPGGTFSVDAGQNITKYTSTGTDTVADLINALNSGPAFVTASISSGKLVITSRDTKDIITIQGSGNDAAMLGFGTNNNSAAPKTPASSKSASSTAASSSTGSTSTSSSSKSATSSSSSKSAVSTIAQELSSSAASILSANGVSGTLVDMLA